MRGWWHGDGISQNTSWGECVVESERGDLEIDIYLGNSMERG